MQRLLRGMAYATLSLALTTTGVVQAADRELDTDGRWGYDQGGTDRDLDNDGWRDD